MTDILPLAFVWTGEVMEPLAPKAADKQYVVGETYQLVPHEDRSRASHSHYFAALGEAFKNLPEDLTERYPTEEHLRKWCLIKAGYRSERAVVCDTPDDAKKVAIFAKAMDDYCVVVVRDTTVMCRKEFQESKEAVLGVLSTLIKVHRDELSEAARTNAK